MGKGSNNPFVKGMIAALIGAILIPWYGSTMWLGAMLGFGFFIIGHAFGHKFGREEKENELKSSQPELVPGEDDGLEGEHLA